MNEFDNVFNQYHYGAKALALKFKKEYEMNKNETIEIKSLQNGYLVERSWREHNGKDDVMDYRYCDEKFMFKTWDEVVEFVTQNKLDVPPAKI